jgi:SpoVK/Ycf46/Vps4 family AAA+-type ATPase
MTYKLRIPTTQYAFVEIEVEGEPEDIARKHYEIQDAFQKIENEREEKRELKPPFGVSESKFLEMIDSISIGGAVSIDDFEGLNESQSKILQSIKRAYKRSPMEKDKQVKR